MALAGRLDAETTLRFLRWRELYAKEKPFQIFADIPEDAEDKRMSNCEWEDKPKFVKDVRGSEARYNLDSNGFMFARQATHVTDFTRREVIESDYLPEVEGLLKERVEGTDKVRCHRSLCQSQRLHCPY